MIPESLSSRSLRFAFLFSGRPEMSREQKVRFYEDLTGSGIELPSFDQKKNEIVLQNVSEGVPPSVTNVTVGHYGDKFRLFVMDDFPASSTKIFKDTADAALKTFSGIWKDSAQGLSLTEVTLRYIVAAEGGNATNYLMKSCLRIPIPAVKALARPLAGVGIRLVSPVCVDSTQKAPLANADFNINIETLLEDPSKLYLQVMAKWPSLPLPAARKPDAQTGSLPTFLNPECRKPSWYIDQVEKYTKEHLIGFLAGAKDS